MELRARLAAERRGEPFLVFRDGHGGQRIIELAPDDDRVTIGRSADCDVPLLWDADVSRIHAQLERVGRQWLVVDDGLSRNGTYVASVRVVGRRRLLDGDAIRVGETIIVFRQPGSGLAATTRHADHHDVAAHVTEAQRRVLVELCRPFKNGATDAVPATNPQIAKELYLTVAAVKTQLRLLFHGFEIEDLPQQEKRRRLVALAFLSGLVTERDL